MEEEFPENEGVKSIYLLPVETTGSFLFVCLFFKNKRHHEPGQSGAVRFTADLGKFCELP